MRILIIGKDTQLLWPQHIKDACDNLGYKNELFLFNNLGLLDPLRSIAKKINNLLSENFIISHLKKTLNNFEPEIIILTSAFFIPKAIYETILNYKKAYIIGWSGDSFDKAVEDKAKVCDKLYCTDSFFVAQALSFGWTQASYLPLAFNEKIFHPLYNGSRNNKIVFIGNPDKKRMEIANNIRIPITFVGPKWSLDDNSIHNAIQKSISIYDVAKMYRDYLGVLNIKQESNVVNGLNMRSFESTACGALMIHDNVEDLKLHFNIGDEVLAYDSIGELEKILTGIQANSRNFDEIAKKGCERAFSEHRYTHRLQTIIDNLK